MTTTLRANDSINLTTGVVTRNDNSAPVGMTDRDIFARAVYNTNCVESLYELLRVSPEITPVEQWEQMHR